MTRPRPDGRKRENVRSGREHRYIGTVYIRGAAAYLLGGPRPFPGIPPHRMRAEHSLPSTNGDTPKPQPAPAPRRTRNVRAVPRVPDAPGAIPCAVRARPVPRGAPLDDASLYFNRELSLLDFNWRVFAQAL